MILLTAFEYVCVIACGFFLGVIFMFVRREVLNNRLRAAGWFVK